MNQSTSTNMDIASIAFGMAIGLVIGLHMTVRHFRKHSIEGEILESSWECTNCGFTASKPLGKCPLCKEVGTPIP